MLICGLLGAIFVAVMGFTVGLNTPFYDAPQNYSWKERLGEAAGGAITGFLLGLIFGLPLNLVLNRKSKTQKVEPSESV